MRCPSDCNCVGCEFARARKRRAAREQCTCGGSCWWCRLQRERAAADSETRGPRPTPSPGEMRATNPLAWDIQERTGLPWREATELLALGRTAEELYAMAPRRGRVA